MRAIEGLRRVVVFVLGVATLMVIAQPTLAKGPPDKRYFQSGSGYRAFDRLRYYPDPAGERGYVFYAGLSVYNPVTGELLHDEVLIPGRLMYKLFPVTRPQYLFLSPDGRRLFVRKYGDPDVYRLRLTVLDTETFEILAEYLACPNDDLWPLPGDRLICVDGATVQVIEVLTGEAIHMQYLPVSEVASAPAPAGDRLYLVTQDAHVAILDAEAEPPQLVGEPVALDAP